MREHLLAQAARDDLNRVCRASPRSNSRASRRIGQQVWSDCQSSTFPTASGAQAISAKSRIRRIPRRDAASSSTLRRDEAWPPSPRAILGTFGFTSLVAMGGSSIFAVLVTSALCRCPPIRSGGLRWWWFSLCVVGTSCATALDGRKPMDRYLVPVMPVMFWTWGRLLPGLVCADETCLRIFLPRPTPLRQAMTRLSSPSCFDSSL